MNAFGRYREDGVERMDGAANLRTANPYKSKRKIEIAPYNIVF